jgi:hypothetical protein
MKYIIGGIAATIFWLIVLYLLPVNEGRYYDCRISEFHPDYPPEVKEECRRIMSGKATIT